jgi:hypothetical protein
MGLPTEHMSAENGRSVRVWMAVLNAPLPHIVQQIESFVSAELSHQTLLDA